MTDYEYLIELLRSTLHRQQAPELPEGCSFARVLALAEQHSVAGMAYYAAETLKSPPTGQTAAAWRQIRDKALVKDITQQAELEAISAALTAGGVRFLPLKGCIIKGLYPQTDMRTMSDIDILIDPENAARARDIMLELGYTCEHFDYEHHDVYFKPPVMNVEIHRELLGAEGRDFDVVFSDPWSMCKQTDGMRYEFRADAFFAYILAHAIKHLDEGGTGIRSVMDIWVCQHSEMPIDREKVLEMLEPSGKSGRARLLIELSEVWFGESPHTESTQEMEQYILGSGTYGNVTNMISNDMQRSGKKTYFLRLLFPTFEHMKRQYPVLKKAPVLLPSCWVLRLVTKPFINRRANAEKLKMLVKK